MVEKILRKTILKDGVYRSPDGEVKVTPARRKRWADTFAKMAAEDAKIPVSWDHGKAIDDLKPLTAKEFEERHSAKNTVGRMTAVEDKGDALEITVEISDPDAMGRAERNEVFISPVILRDWTNSRGTRFTDCITHGDLVNHPVDHSQGPFVPADTEPGVIACALRMGLSTNLYKAIRMADDGDDKPKDDKDDKPTDAPKADDNPDDDGAPDAAVVQMKDLLEALSAHKLILGEDTTAANLAERLMVALKTATAHSGDEPDGDEPVGEPTLKVTDPNMQTMSLQARAAFNFAERTHKSAVQNSLQELLDQGKCSPAEHKEKSACVNAVKLSLDNEGNPQEGDVEKWISSRRSVPKGTFWDASVRTARMSLTPEAHPSHVSGGVETDEDAEKLVDNIFGKK